MKAGGYNEIVKIYQSLTKISDYGEQTKEYRYECTTKAGVLFNKGERKSLNSEIFFPNQYTIVVHSYINIMDDTRIEFQGKMYKVIEYHKDRRQRDQEVKIEAIV